MAARSGRIVNHPKGPVGNASAPEIAAARKDASAVSLRARKSASLDCVSTLDGTSLITLKRTVNSFSNRSIFCAAPLRIMDSFDIRSFRLGAWKLNDFHGSTQALRAHRALTTVAHHQTPAILRVRP